MTTTSKTAVPSTPAPKTIVPMPVTVKADDKTKETSSLDEDFFVKNAPNETLAWSVAPQNLKPCHIITSNIYPKD